MIVIDASSLSNGVEAIRNAFLIKMRKVTMTTGKTSFYESLHYMEKAKENGSYMTNHGFDRPFPKSFLFKSYQIRKSRFNEIINLIKGYVNVFS